MMKVGLLWLDDSPTRPLAQKVALAVVAYRKKFGSMPNKCYVNPSAFMPRLPEGSQIMAAQMMVGSVEVEPLKTVLRCHFWIGREKRTKEVVRMWKHGPGDEPEQPDDGCGDGGVVVP